MSKKISAREQYVYPIRMTPQLEKKVKAAAAKQMRSLQNYIVKLLTDAHK